MNIKIKLLIGSCFLTAISFNAVAHEKNSHNNEPTTCSLKTLKGTYIFASQTDTSAMAGMESYDGGSGGVGHVKSIYTIGGSKDIITSSGTYTVNTDCTGTYTSGSYTSNNFIDPSGKSKSWIETDGGGLSSGIESRISKEQLVH